MKLSATARGVGANLQARVLSLVALTVTSLVVARTAGTAGVGDFTLLRVAPWLTGLILSNGVYAAAPYFLSGPDRIESRFRTTIPAMAVVAGIVGGVVWAVASPLFAHVLFRDVPPALVALAGVSVLTQLVESTSKACSQGFGDLAGSNRVIVLEELLFLPWYGVLLLSGCSTYTAIVLALPLGDITTSVTAWTRLARRGYFSGVGAPSLRLARRVSRYGLRAEVGSVMQTLNARLDFALVAGLLGPQAVGVYAIASRYAELLRLPSLALNYVLLPTYARGGTTSRGEADRAIGRLWWTPALAAVPMALLAPAVLPLAYGGDFRASAAPACVLLVGLCGGVVNGIVTAYLAAVGRPGLNSLAIGSGLVVTVLLDVALIPRFHVMGAAAASSFTYLTTTVMLVVLFRRHGSRSPAEVTPETVASVPAARAPSDLPGQVAVATAVRVQRGTTAKRVFDVTVAALTLVLVSPLMLLIAVLILLDSAGPVLFRQVRVGRCGQRFEIFKFRTMATGAERAGPHISPTGDPRITRVGRWLRRSYLDELPQLLNVLRGEMSLVGPRPETPDFVALYGPQELRVLDVRPGVLGPSTLGGMNEEDRLAAVDDPVAFYVSTILPERVQADLSYLDTWSMRGDIRLMGDQISAIVRRRA